MDNEGLEKIIIVEVTRELYLSGIIPAMRPININTYPDMMGQVDFTVVGDRVEITQLIITPPTHPREGMHHDEPLIGEYTKNEVYQMLLRIVNELPNTRFLQYSDSGPIILERETMINFLNLYAHRCQYTPQQILEYDFSGMKATEISMLFFLAMLKRQPGSCTKPARRR